MFLFNPLGLCSVRVRAVFTSPGISFVDLSFSFFGHKLCDVTPAATSSLYVCDFCAESLAPPACLVCAFPLNCPLLVSFCWSFEEVLPPCRPHGFGVPQPFQFLHLRPRRSQERPAHISAIGSHIQTQSYSILHKQSRTVMNQS